MENFSRFPSNREIIDCSFFSYDWRRINDRYSFSHACVEFVGGWVFGIVLLQLIIQKKYLRIFISNSILIQIMNFVFHRILCIFDSHPDSRAIIFSLLMPPFRCLAVKYREVIIKHGRRLLRSRYYIPPFHLVGLSIKIVHDIIK